MSKKKSTKLRVRWEPSSSSGTEYFTWEELGCEDEAEFYALDDQEQAQRIAEALDGVFGLCHAQCASAEMSFSLPK